MVLHIAALSIYPVKGLRGLDLPEAEVERHGLRHDRRWAVLRPDGVVLTQRDLGTMARIDAVPDGDGLRLECAGFGGVDARAAGPDRVATLWRRPVPVVEANREASEWLGRVLGTPCTLVHQADPTGRPVTPDLARPGDCVSLADGFPLLVTTAASLAILQAELPDPVPMGRFRPNLVVDGAEPWAEDGWAHLDTGMEPGAVRLRLASPCVRCKVITLDQRTGEAPVRMEPLRTLGRLHRDAEGGVCFGWNAVPERCGTLRLGGSLHRSLR